jgi:hypothetical protein
MKPETLEILRARWQRLRIYRYRGSVLVDYAFFVILFVSIIQQEQQ